MAIIVEDGTIVAGANSYVTETELENYAEDRGVTLGGDPAVLLVAAADYLETFRNQYRGALVDRDQPLAWPRDGAVIEGFAWDDDEIPRQVLLAQMIVAVEIGAGEDPLNPPAALPVVKERVEGAVEVQYAAPVGFKLSKTSKARALINALTQGAGYLRIIRA